MKLRHFNYNNKKYASGTVIKIKPCRNKNNIIIEKAIFEYYIPNAGWYVISLGPDDMLTLCEKDFFKIIIAIIDEKKVETLHATEVKIKLNPTFKEELKIENMFIAWIWYVFLMVLLIFFRNAWISQIFISIIFFKYRNKKIREAGYK